MYLKISCMTFGGGDFAITDANLIGERARSDLSVLWIDGCTNKEVSNPKLRRLHVALRCFSRTRHCPSHHQTLFFEIPSGIGLLLLYRAKEMSNHGREATLLSRLDTSLMCFLRSTAS